MLYCIVIGVCRLWREIFGLIDNSYMIGVECFVSILSSNFVFLITEMTIIRYLYIIVWKRVKEIDDEFWACFLNIVTTFYSSWMTMIEHTPARVCTYVLKIMTSGLTESVESIRYRTLILWHEKV